MNQFPEMTPELRDYLEQEFESLHVALDDRAREYATIMQALRIVCQRLASEDALDNLLTSLEHGRKAAASRRRKK